ncbi:MAG: hypothetical protein SOX20_03980 [Parolsenella sp.]|uniref:hypothetical protein n=1 Tax=Parolsenella sp. TaxID=2083006 RepID=UPI002A7609CC|nr:hypothetical protein [Parolsenella sp.]MCI5950119.1 hypothetical protein [Coriobacteriaceae bacterium]MDY3292069.1 hypothetical protein [Parolsenella sp.]
MSSSGQNEGLRHYEVLLARSVKERLLGIPSRDDARRIARRLRMLEVAPAMGEVYEPVYESAMPDHEVRVTFTGHYGIYYTIDETAGTVGVEFLEDCRRDPMRKFS